MKKALFIFFFFIETAFSAEVAIEDVVTSFELVPPKPYGVFVGDILNYEINFTTRDLFVLDEGSLPQKGALNYWLELKELDIEKEKNGETSIYRISLYYQTFYVPLVVTEKTIPEINLQLGNSVNHAKLVIPSQHFHMSPLKPVVQRGVAEGSSQAMVPMSDHSLGLRGTRHIVLKLSLLGLSVIFIIMLYAFSRGWLFSINKTPFLKAKKKIVKLKQDEEVRQAFRALHHAFNETYGKTVFISSLDDFFIKNKEFLSCKKQIEQFFKSSSSIFYGQEYHGVKTVINIKELADFCRELSDLEKISINKSSR